MTARFCRIPAAPHYPPDSGEYYLDPTLTLRAYWRRADQRDQQSEVLPRSATPIAIRCC